MEGGVFPKRGVSPKESVDIPGALSLNKTRCLYLEFEGNQERGAREKVSPSPRVSEKSDRATVREHLNETQHYQATAWKGGKEEVFVNYAVTFN